MYTLALRKKFIARHHNSEASNEQRPTRSHLYTIELMLEAEDLDSEGYLLDLDELETELDAILALYRDKELNALPAFADARPTVEHFVQVLGDAMNESLYAPQLTAISVRLWRDESVWAMYDIEK